jgi:hypothetical protein
MRRLGIFAALVVSACDCGGEPLGDPLGSPPDAGTAPRDAGPAPTIPLPTLETIVVDGDRPVALAIGSLFFDESISLAVLACRGGEAECRVGAAATAPFGATRLAVFNGIGQTPRRLSIGAEGGLGILPAGIAIGVFGGGAPSLALVNSRTAICQRRVCAPNLPCGCWRPDPNVPIECPCESSEVLLFGVANSVDLLLQARLTLTGSNAVGLAFVEQGAEDTLVQQLAIAQQGRSRDERPCLRVSRCLPYLAAECGDDLCGCPPDEQCRCTPDACGDGRTPGVCYANDETIDLVAIRSGEAFHRFSCRTNVLQCSNDGNPAATRSLCVGPGDDNPSDRFDGCACRVPTKIHVGDTSAPSKPTSIAAGPLHAAHDWGLIAASEGGLQLFRSEVTRRSWRWETTPNLQAKVDEAIVAQLDPSVDGATPKADAIWLAREACPPAVPGEGCTKGQGPRPDLSARGCLGTYASKGTPLTAGDLADRCARFDLDFVPGKMCSADFDRDGTDDVAVTDPEGDRVLVFLGDGQGALRTQPATIPVNAPGPIACGDLDGDARPDLAIGDLDDGSIHLVRSR